MKPCSNIRFFIRIFISILIIFFLQKSLTIFHAALYGGAVITTGLDYFVEHSVMLMWVWDRVRVKESKPICWFSWAIVATWPLTFLLGKIFCYFFKFIYSDKATKFCKIFTLLLSYVVPVKSKVKIF